MRELVAGLQAHPEIGVAPAHRLQPVRDLGGYSNLLIHKHGQVKARRPNPVGALVQSPTAFLYAI